MLDFLDFLDDEEEEDEDLEADEEDALFLLVPTCFLLARGEQ